MSTRNDSTIPTPGSGRKPLQQGNSRGTGVFLDRDGTLNEEVGYVNHLSRVRLYPWAAEAIRMLNEAGVPVIVVTNQSGVARGYFTEEMVQGVHRRIADELAAQSARIDALYYCPHHPDAPLPAYHQVCRCRKPEAGMVEEAARQFHIDPTWSYVVGDSYRDMRLGFKVGARTILVKTGYGLGEFEYHRHEWPRQPDLVAENLLDAVKWILEDIEKAGATRSNVSAPREL